MPAWNAQRVKVQLRLATARLKTSQEKKASVQKVLLADSEAAARRDIATLLEKGKIETARIKTESIINEDIHLELLELLELYCEILTTRFGLIENSNAREPDPGVSEAVIGIVYAAHRTEVKELHYIRESFMHRYGRDWSVSVMENLDNKVSARVREKCTNDTPPPVLVDGYLYEIARGYNVDWVPPEPPSSLDLEELEAALEEVEEDDEAAQSPAESAVTGQPPAESSQKPVPRSILRNASSSGPQRKSNPPPYVGPGVRGGDKKVDPTADDKEKEEDPEQALLRRFAALSGRKPGG